MDNVFEHYLLGQKLYQQIVNVVQKKYNLTYMEFTIIMFIANNNYDTASDIVKYRCLTKSHVSTSIKSLINKGLLEEFYYDNDHKSKHLMLTKDCDIIVNDGRSAQKKFVDILNINLTKADIKKMFEIVDIMNNNIKDNLVDYGRDNNAR